jgi:arginase
VLDAPSNLGLRPPRPGVEPGVKGLPDAIRATGWLERLRARDLGRAPAPAYSPDDEPFTGYRNGLALARYSREVATRLSPLLKSRQFTLVLGGDCSVLLGAGLALREHGRYGLAFIDGHDDFSPPRDPSKYTGHIAAAGRDLALVTGTGPEQLIDIDGRKPYFRIADVVQIGVSRTEEDRKLFQVEQFDKSGIAILDIDAIRNRGADHVSYEARQRLDTADTDGFWIHLDADVLDASIMPAVDSPNPTGMTFEQLRVILSQLLASPKAVGMELTIFDPSLDPDGHLAKQLADVIELAFKQSGRTSVGENSGQRSENAMQDDATFASVLLAPAPAPKVAGNADIFAPLLGGWDLDVVFYHPDGSIKKQIPGEWHFARALEGRAIEDVWIVPPRDMRKSQDPPSGEYGVTLRFYDPRINAWHSVWHGVVNGIVWPFIGRRVGDEIVLERMDDGGNLMHWVFFDMRHDGFQWRSEVSSDGGKTWRIEQVMRATRQAAELR